MDRQEIIDLIKKAREDIKDTKGLYGTDSMGDTYDEGWCDATDILCDSLTNIVRITPADFT